MREENTQVLSLKQHGGGAEGERQELLREGEEQSGREPRVETTAN